MIYLAMGPEVLPLFWVILLVVIDTVGQTSRMFVKKKAANSFGKAKTALITIMIILAGIELLHGDLPFVTVPFLHLLTVCCTVLAFLSFYCKVVPDIWYANTFTLANFTCGVVAIILVWENKLLHAFVLVFLGQFFDLFDGRLARKFGSTRFGALFDDIADGTSFGLATSLIIFASLGSNLPALVLASAFCVCVIVRLVRFLRFKDALPAGIFSGLPSPAGALLAGSSALLFVSQPALCYMFTIIATIAMVSPVKYRHFAQRIWPTLPNILKISLSVAVIVFVSKGVTGRFFYTDYLSIELFAFGLSILYLVFGREKAAEASLEEEK
jgi:CDP-diacylglycerol--serine O-phosphatidyltransferase